MPEVPEALFAVKKKLREAEFFLRKLAERSRLAFGDREEFDFLLSAFLCASRSIDYRLRHEQGEKYRTFHKNWERALNPDERKLIKLLVDDRNLEVHQSGSGRLACVAMERIGNSYQDASGRVEVFAPPRTPAARIGRPTYSFRLGDVEVSAVECCQKYLAVLDRLVNDYCRHVGAA